MWAHSPDFVGQDLAQELGVEIADAAITDAPDTHVLFRSANFTSRDTTGTNTVTDDLVAGIKAATRPIHLASGHVRSREIAESLVAKHAAAPNVDIRIYLDGQEYIAKGKQDIQVAKMQTCLAAVDIRYAYYAYRWDFTYAASFEANFESFWKTGKDEDKLSPRSRRRPAPAALRWTRSSSARRRAPT